MIIYQSVDSTKKKVVSPIKKTIVPGVNSGQPMDGICHLHSTNQTTSSCCENQADYIFVKDNQSLKEYVMKKDAELSKKIEILNSKFVSLEKIDKELDAKISTLETSLTKKDNNLENQIKDLDATLEDLDNYVKTIQYEGADAIEVKEIPDSSIKEISLRISKYDKVISQSPSGLMATIKIDYNKEEKRINLIGKGDSLISSCDLDFVPSNVSKIQQDGKTFVKFDFSDGQFFLVDINQFLEISYDGDGCFSINGKKVGIKVSKDDKLLYVDDVHALRTRNITELQEWKVLQLEIDAQKERINKLEKNDSLQDLNINELKLKLEDGGSFVDPETGETIVIESIKDGIIGSKDDEIKIDTETGEVDQSTLTLNSIIRLIQSRNDEDFKWNEA